MAKKSILARNLPKVNLDLARFKKFRIIIAWFLAINNISSVLSIIYYIIWIPVGLFFLWFIVANFRVGAFDQLMSAKKSDLAQTQEQSIPAETAIPGIGRVDVACVQSSLQEDAIVKIVREKSTASLTDDEKAKLEPCIVEREQASSSPSS